MSVGTVANVNYSPSQSANVVKWAIQNQLAGVFFWSMNQEVNYNLPNFCNTPIPSGTPESKIMSKVFKNSLAIISEIEAPTQTVASPVATKKQISTGISSVAPSFDFQQRAKTGIPDTVPENPFSSGD